MALSDILRCQVLTHETGGYASCGAEAKKFELFKTEGVLAGRYAIVVCERHANPGAEEIGLKANDELRDYCRSFLGADPLF